MLRFRWSTYSVLGGRHAPFYANNEYLNQIKGYEQYKASSLLQPQDKYWYFGKDIKYLGSPIEGLNVWEDVLPVDNYFFGMVTCNQIQQLLELKIFTDYFLGGSITCTP